MPPVGPVIYKWLRELSQSVSRACRRRRLVELLWVLQLQQPAPKCRRENST